MPMPENEKTSKRAAPEKYTGRIEHVESTMYVGYAPYEIFLWYKTEETLEVAYKRDPKPVIETMHACVDNNYSIGNIVCALLNLPDVVSVQLRNGLGGSSKGGVIAHKEWP